MRYIRRLKRHPGVSVALAIQVVCFLAALSNPNFEGLTYPLFVLGMSSLVWIPVLITNKGEVK